LIQEKECWRIEPVTAWNPLQHGVGTGKIRTGKEK
jgi:hypothetical protein